MKVGKESGIEARNVDEQGIEAVKMKVLISEQEGAPNFVMRLFEIEPNGHTAYHTHAWEHEVYVLSGTGAVKQGDRELPIEEGSYVFVKPNEEHQFINTGEKPLKFICVVPITK